MTVGLVMIVKDEAAILPRLADSVRDHIDYFTIVDTGSTDDTLEVLDRIFTPLPGQVLQHDFDGFGPSRTMALQAADSHTDWMLCLDADETFHGYISVDDGDVVEAEQHNGAMRFWLPRLLRSGRCWESKGRAHEYYWSPVASGDWVERTDTFYVEHHGDGSGRPGKFQRDSELLLADWDEDSSNSRTAFYLARSYDDAGDMSQAVNWYRQRIAMGGWHEEIFYSKFRVGVCLLNLGAKEEGCGYLWSAWGDKPQRAEPMVALAEHYRLAGLWILAWHVTRLAQDYYDANQSGLFVDTSMDWRLLYEISIIAWYAGHKEWGKQAMFRLLERPDIPEPFYSSIRSNQEFYFS